MADSAGGSTHGPEPDDRDDAPGRPRPVPHPLDRLWRHPSELGALAAPRPPARRRAGVLWLTATVSGVVGALGAVALLAALGALGDDGDRSEVSTAAPTAQLTRATDLAYEATHAVVAVTVKDAQGTRRGSGVCVGTDGEVLTSDRLLGGAAEVTVTDYDGRVHAARVVGRDPYTDLALIAIDAPLHLAPFSDRTVAPGDEIVAVGAPGPEPRGPWVSRGVVATVDALASPSHAVAVAGLIETDVPAGLNAAGGALLDEHDAVVGVLMAPIDGHGGGYAVPVSTARAVASQLAEHGAVEHGWLGIEGVDDAAGPRVSAVVAHGPADRGGLQVGDVVTKVGHHEVFTMTEVLAAVRHHTGNDRVEVCVQRGGRKLRLEVLLGDEQGVR